MFTLPAGFTNSVASSTNSVFSAYAPVVALVAGTLLAVVAIELLIGALSKKH